MRPGPSLVRGGLLASLLVMAGGIGFANAQASPVDRRYSEELSSGIDGKPARISLQVSGRDFKAPFSWTLRVDRDGKLLDSGSVDDAWHDAFFADEGYLEGCSGYQECKRLRYDNRLPAQLKRVVSIRLAPEGSADVLDRELAVPIVIASLERRGLNADQRQAALAEVRQLWAQGFVSLEVPLSPMVSWSLMDVSGLASFIPYQRNPHSNDLDVP